MGHESTNIDLAKEYSDPIKILEQLDSNKYDDIELLKIIYQRVKDHESFVYKSADDVRDKAKSLLGASSFTAAIFFGVAALFMSALKGFPIIIVITEFTLFILQIFFFGWSLILAMKVMTREQIVRPSPDEFLNVKPTFFKKQQIINAYMYAIAHMLAFANQTLEYLRAKGNKLVTAQKYFGYGLICFSLFLITHFVCLYKNGIPPDSWGKLTEFEQRINQRLEKSSQKEVEAIDKITAEISKLRNARLRQSQ